MKTKGLIKLLVGLTLAASGALAVGSGLSNKKATQTSAAGYMYSEGTIIYLDPSSFDANNNWTGGYLGAWCHYNASNSSNSDMWEEFSYDNLSGKYYITLSHECASFTMARYATSGGSRHHTTSWGGSVWNEGRFEFQSGKNYLYATGFMTGNWQTLTYHVAGDHNSWAGTDASYKMIDGFDDDDNHQASFTFNNTSANNEIKCTINYNGTVPSNDWYGTLATGYNTNHVGSRNGNILLKTVGTYEVYLKSDRTVWVQISSADEADHYAQEFLTNITCNDNSVTSSLSAWNKVGEETTSMEYKWEHLTHGAQNVLKGATANQNGSNVERCVARYVRILSKYGYGTGNNQYHDFMDKKPALLSGSKLLISTISNNNTNTIAIIVIISLVSVTVIGGYFFIKRRQEN